MYIMITTRCNMSCAHCCFACTADGEDMSLEVFRAAMNYGDDICTIGGGEPTLHPQFWQILGEAMANYYDVWLATNGSVTKTALALAKLAEKGIIGCDLSQDMYHDRIDPEVIAAFTKDKSTQGGLNFDFYTDIHDKDRRAIRDVTNSYKGPFNAGRCDFGDDGCPCDGAILKPNGDIYHCGCSDAPLLGNILFDDIEMITSGCWKEEVDD